MPTPQLPDKTDYLSVLRAHFTQAAGAVDLFPILWRLYVGKPPALAYWYVRRDLLDGLLHGQYAGVIKYTEADVTEDNSAAFHSLQGIRDAANAEILRLEAIGRASRGGAVGQMTTTAPISADYPGQQAEPNAREYRGDPLRRR
jgi:hypothetical protein